MNNPFYRVLIIIIISCALSQLVFVQLDSGLLKFNCFTNEKLTEMLVKPTEYKLITLGSSRSLSHVNPAVLDSVLKIKTYNAGIAGANIYEIKTVFNAYLNVRKTAPEFVVLNIDRRTLSNLQKFYNNTIYYPYLNNVVIDSTLKEIGIKTYLYRYMPFVQLFEYDDYMRNIGIQGHKNKNEINVENTYYHGFMSLAKTKVFHLKSDDKLEFDNLVTNEGINHLVEILNTCTQKGIKLIFVFAPELHAGNYPINKSLFTIDSIAKIHHLDILRFDNLDSIYTAKNFADKRHLNGLGADRFSLHLAQSLAPIIKLAK